MAPKVNRCTDTEPTQTKLTTWPRRLDQQLADDGQVADVHDADVDARLKASCGFQKKKRISEQHGQQKRQAAAVNGGAGQIR
jgi:hypothetical protein